MRRPSPAITEMIFPVRVTFAVLALLGDPAHADSRMDGTMHVLGSAATPVNVTTHWDPRQPAWARDSLGTRLAEVPPSLRQPIRDSLLQRRAAIADSVDSLNGRANAFNARCREIRDPGTLAWCERALAQYKADSPRIELLKLNFNEAVREASRRGLRINEPPPPAVTTEQTRFRDNPQQWLNERREAVRAAVNEKRNWTDRILRILTGPQTERRYATTPLAALAAGDVILIAPINEQLDPTSAAGSEFTQELDYRYRVVTTLLRGRLVDAATQDRQPASHALTFLGSIHGVRMYLSEQPGGSRILDERAFLREYGARQMYVARPQAVVDGRRLWSAARNTAVRNARDYGLFGDRAVCSERAGIVVARATGLNLDPDRPGPIDITPGDFFDAQGNVGKHFVITGLRITGVPQER